MTEKMHARDFDAVFAIMEASFPDDERRPYAEELALLEDPAFGIRVSRDASGIHGFITVWELEDFAFIEHFAVAPHSRNSGIGGRMLRETVALLGKPVCLEVEPPADALTRRRIGFYERNGFVLNQYPYTQPPISRGKPPVPLALMTFGRAVDKAEFEHYRDVLYKRVYKWE